MPDVINPVTGGTLSVSDDVYSAFLGRGFTAVPEAKPDKPADKPAPKRGRPRKADTDRD